MLSTSVYILYIGWPDRTLLGTIHVTHARDVIEAVFRYLHVGENYA